MMNPLRRLALPLLALALTAAPLVAQETNPNVRFGMPGPASKEQREAYLIARPQYVLSYNAKTRTPNWVCWRLMKSDIGRVPRAPFTPDPDLPRGMTKVTSHVYDGAGFDRGHMCPAKDRSATRADTAAVFHMTNIIPQSPHSNQRAWERLENYCRELAKQGHTLYICCGPQGVGGTGENKDHKEVKRKEIGKGEIKVTVPAKLWKVILVLPREDAEPRKNTRVIAVIMTNDEKVDFNWAKHRVSVKQVERLTGYKFFPEIPEDVATALKARVDEVKVRDPRPGHGGDKRPRRHE
jgi:endonuclease G